MISEVMVRDREEEKEAKYMKGNTTNDATYVCICI